MIDPFRISRKDFVRLGGLGAAAVILGVEASADRAFAEPAFSSDPFTLGVASGDPLPGSVVLWTRLLPAEGGLPNRRVRVRWKVATDEAMKNVVARGERMTGPEGGYSVHVDVRGLKPNREYFYKFRAGDFVSPTGRTRTTPAFGSSPAALAFAFVSCQEFQNGFYAAYGALARQEQDLAFVVHLGDYLYEDGPRASAVPGREHEQGSGQDGEIVTLADYRDRYAQYKGDEDMREAHRMFPFIVTTDDHEVDNNYAAAIPEEDSITKTRDDLIRRRAAAYKAYYENMPLRRSSLPQGANMRLYRRFSYGDLAGLSILDTRQYRTDQPCGDGFTQRCAGALSESQTMTGPEQERWLKEGLARSRKVWNVIGQQTMLAEYDFRAGPDTSFNMDQWDGYVAARKRLIGFLNKSRVRNPITLTGDIHSAWVHDLKTDFADETSKTVGTEFVGTSITSSFPGVFIPVVEGARADNPHTKFFDGANRGYTRCDLNRERYLTTFKAIPTEPGAGSVLTPEATSTTLAAFVVENGRPGATQVEGQAAPAPTTQGEIDRGYQQLTARNNW